MFRLSCWPLGLLLFVGCAPAPDLAVTLNGVASGAPVSLDEVDAWESIDDPLTAQLSLVSPKSTVTCTRDGAAAPCPRSTAGDDVVRLDWPLTTSGREQTTVAVIIDGAEAGKWTVSRTVVDPGLSVCAANTTGEDDGQPLDRCKQLDPFSDVELPIDRTDGLLFKRARFTVQRGRVDVTRLSLVPHGDDEQLWVLFRRGAEVTPSTPVLLELDTQARVSAGARALTWRAPSVTLRTVRDLDPARPPVRVRVGGRAEISRSIQRLGESAELTGFLDGAAVLTLTSSLPVRLEAAAPLGLTVAITPTGVGPRSLWPRLTFRSPSGDWTDRIPFRVEGLAPTDCRIEISDLNFGSVLIGETRVARLQVRNTGTTTCPKFRLRSLPAGLQLESRPIPAPGEVAEWRVMFSAQSVGPQVVLLEADLDDTQPSFADLTVRVEATVTR